jgi:hypothetical protein
MGEQLSFLSKPLSLIGKYNYLKGILQIIQGKSY